jgi:hypothetical protein
MAYICSEYILYRIINYSSVALLLARSLLTVDLVLRGLLLHPPQNQASPTEHVRTIRILAMVLEGREADDEAMFKKRYEEYVQENEEIVNIGRGRSWWRWTPVRERRSRGRSSMTDWRRTSSRRILWERGLRIGRGTASRRGLDRSFRGSGSRCG